MQDYEKLGVFYLGRTFDLASGVRQDSQVLYDSRDLVTHGVCLGMTGSGKTGLCLALLEEAAIDGIPVIAVDPKGDLGNLLLTFPNLAPEDFRPWVNEDDARRKGVTTEQFAAGQAELWKKGLAEWGEDGARIGRLRAAADFAIYTPGSNAGLPLSLLRSLDPPPPALRDDREAFADKVNTTATSLLTLAGIDVEPVRSREHILLATILNTAWGAGRSLDLASLIQQIQQPPVQRVGVLELESFFPSADRFGLATAFNNLLAAPGFDVWMEGDALNVDRLLYTADGRPRVSVISIAHLGDRERMFFVSLLLNEILGWMRTQPGTTSLRALVYMDEIFGYFPPVANPPSKLPLLTLLKQGRAFGLGCLLATQNPVDIDYKGLSNAGTWWLGRLQTERDKARVLEGLEGAVTSGGGKFDRAYFDKALSGLRTRVFVMNNVHEDAPVVMESRWAMSYLRGPLTREQIRQLMAARRAQVTAAGTGSPTTAAAFASSAAAPVSGTAAPAFGSPAQPAATGAAAPTYAPAAAQPLRASAPAASWASAPPAEPQGAASVAAARPLLPPDIQQFYLPRIAPAQAGATLAYMPMAIGVASVAFSDSKTGIAHTRALTLVAEIDPRLGSVAWADASALDVPVRDLGSDPEGEARFASLPPAASKAKTYDAWSKDLKTWLGQTQTLELLKSSQTGVISAPGESERDFRIRMQTLTREQRDQAVEKLRQKYASKVTALDEKIRRAQLAVDRESEQASAQKLQTAVSLGATVLGALFGRKALSTSTLGRATTAARGVGRTMKEGQDIALAKQTLAAAQQQKAELEEQIRTEVDKLGGALDPSSETLVPFALKPKRTDISIQIVALAWAPAWQDSQGRLAPAWKA